MAPGAAHGVARPHAQTVAVLGPERTASGGPDLPGHGARVYASKVASRSPGDRPITLGATPMRTVPPRSSLALLAAVVAAFAAPAAASAADGQVIVKYASGADAQDRADARDDAGVVRDEALPLPSTELVTPEAGTSVADAVADLERSRDVAYAEPDHHAARVRPLPRRGPGRRRTARRSTTSRSRTCGVSTTPARRSRAAARSTGADIGAPAAWGVTTGSKRHQGRGRRLGRRPLAPRSLRQSRPGYDFAYDDADPTDYEGHGTHVAGIIGARGNNGTGVTGVAWDTSLMPVQALDADGAGYTSDIVAADTYAATHGARIVNASFGGSSPSQSEYDAIRNAPNVLFVVAAGNEGATTTRGRPTPARTTCRTSSASRRPTTPTTSRRSRTSAARASTSRRPASTSTAPTAATPTGG